MSQIILKESQTFLNHSSLKKFWLLVVWCNLFCLWRSPIANQILRIILRIII
ncbi:MAG: hypothetical protein ACRC2R_20030 [Xenococcaceae cyanobacterium]